MNCSWNNGGWGNNGYYNNGWNGYNTGYGGERALLEGRSLP